MSNRDKRWTSYCADTAGLLTHGYAWDAKVRHISSPKCSNRANIDGTKCLPHIRKESGKTLHVSVPSCPIIFLSPPHTAIIIPTLAVESFYPQSPFHFVFRHNKQAHHRTFRIYTAYITNFRRAVYSIHFPVSQYDSEKGKILLNALPAAHRYYAAPSRHCDKKFVA